MAEVIIVPEGGLRRDIRVEAGQRTDMILVVMPGVSCDVALDVTLAGEGAEANIYSQVSHYHPSYRQNYIKP